MKDITMPDFIIIGGQRCGTTSLYYYLTRHPSVVKAVKKELCFFDLNYEKGVEWYRKQFPKIEETHTRRQITGEASPFYLFHPLAAERAVKIVPHAKLIIMLRNPVDRAYSHYQHIKRLDMEDLSFKDALEKEPERIEGEAEKIAFSLDPYNSYSFQHHSYLARGVYIDQIKTWFNFFPREQFLIINCEDFYRDPGKILKEVEAFLGLSSFEYGELEKWNRVMCKSMDETIREKLYAYYSDWNTQLEEYLDMDFGWNKSRSIETTGEDTERISVVVSLRNTAEYNRELQRLDDVLISLKNQTVKQIDIIVSDTDSDAGYREKHKRICDRYGVRHVYTKTNKAWNIARARNIGIKNARAPYIMTTDVDCVFPPLFIETVLMNVEKNTIGHCRVWELPEGYEGALDEFMDMKSASRLREKGGYGTCQIFSKEWAFKIRGFDENFIKWGAEDTDFYVRALQDGLKEIWLETQTDFFHQWHSETNRHEDPEQLKRNRARCIQTRNNELPIVRNPSGWGEHSAKEYREPHGKKLSDTAILITTFLRDDHLFRGIKSIRKYYPEIAIYVGDNGEANDRKKQFCRDHGCIYYKLPFDSGVSEVRNRCFLRMAKKYKYVVICEEDIVFSEDTRLETWRAILDSDPQLGMVGGLLKTNDTAEQHYEADSWIKDGSYYIKELKTPTWKRTKSGGRYFICDLILNFFMMRRQVWDTVPWDGQFKSSFEHSDFFTRLKYQTDRYHNPVFDNDGDPVLRKQRWLVAYAPEIWAYHNRMNNTNKRYKKYRKRSVGWILFADKWLVETFISTYNRSGEPINLREIGLRRYINLYNHSPAKMKEDK